MAAILREASTSLRGRPAVAGRFLAVDILMRVNLHQEAPSRRLVSRGNATGCAAIHVDSIGG